MFEYDAVSNTQVFIYLSLSSSIIISAFENALDLGWKTRLQNDNKRNSEFSHDYLFKNNFHNVFIPQSG